MPTNDYPLTVTYHPGTSLITKYQDGIKTWVRTVNFKALKGWNLPVNPYVHATWNGTGCNLAYATWTHKTNGSSGQNGPYGISLAEAYSKDLLFDTMISQSGIQSASSVLNELIVKTLVKASDSKVNLAVAMAESAKTADMILGKATQLFNAYRAFRRGRLREAANILNITPKKVHKTWLEYKYGWTPLLMDVVGGAEHLAQQHLGGRPLRFSVKSTKKVEGSKSTTQVDTYSTGAQGTTKHVAKASRRHQVKLWFEVTNQNLSHAQQLGLTNPLLVAWEVVPFSFVFDWFISVGNYCQALTAMDGLSLHKAAHSVLTEKEGTYVYSSTSGQDANYVYGGITVDYKLKFKGFERSVPSVDPLAIYPPSNPSKLNWEKMLTGAALLRSKARGLENIRI